MPTLAQLAQEVLDNYDDLSSTDGNVATRLAQVTDFGTEILEEVAQHAQWDFLVKSASVTFTAGQNYATLPTDFLGMPYSGKLLNADGTAMIPVTMGELVEKRLTYTGDPLYYAITYRIETTTIPTPSSTKTLIYLSAPSETTNFPTVFHRSVILQGMIAKAMESKGEAGPFWEKYQRGLAEMVRRLRPTTKNRTFVFPLARGGMC